MKNILVILLVIGFTGQAMAQASEREVLLSEKTVMLDVEISPTNVKLSTADYSMPVVKVLVPQLADVTILNHRNTAEGAPCLATYETKLPQDIIQAKPATEKIAFTIRLSKIPVLSSIHHDLECSVFLVERIEGNIRGFKFQHEREQQVANRDAADCR